MQINNALMPNSIKNFLLKKIKINMKNKLLWKKFKIWTMLAVGIILFAVIIKQISLSEFINVFSSVKIKFFIASILLGVAATVFKTIRFEYFFPAPGRRLNLYGTFAFLRVAYYVLPFNSGEFVYLSVLKKSRFSPTIAETTPTWFFLRSTDVIALAVWFIIALNIGHLTDDLYGKLYSLRWIIMGISITLVIIIFSFPFWIPKISYKSSDNWFIQRLNLFRIGLTRTFGIKTFVRTFINAILIWSALIGSEVLAQLAFNTPLDLSQCFLASITVYCVSLLPINTPLSLGTGEAIWSGVMILAGVNAGLAISIALSIRVVSMTTVLIDGLIGFSILTLRSNGNKS